MPNTQDSTDFYFIPGAEADFRLMEKGSRFIGWCGFAGDESEALSHLEKRVNLHHNATHHCWAYRIGRPGEVKERSSDAGEPSGTAGKPILEQMRHRCLFDAVLVVTRWFGGVKLGKGGLIRTYGACAAGALERLPKEERIIGEKLDIICSLALVGLMQGLIIRAQGRIISSDYTDKARLVVELPRRKVSEFQQALNDKSAGQIVCRIIG